MKKIMFLQIKGKSFGGIWLVNKTLADKFTSLGYDVQVCSIRDNHPGNYEETNFKQHTINDVLEWKIVHKRDVLLSVKKHCFFKTLKKYINDKKKLNNDYKKMKQYILKEKPDYIIASHYQTLPGIPKQYLNKTIHVQHSAFKLVKQDKYNYRTLKKYNKKLFSLVWLSKSTYEFAQNEGFIKNMYIYNPVRIKCEKKADVVKNKQLVVLSRFSFEKRIDLMVEMVNDVFKDNKFKDWKFCLYGQGELSEKTLNIINKNNQIFNMGVANDAKKVLLESSCSLNTSIYEGFPLSIIESLTCGVPSVIFDYGESAKELIIDGKTGFVVEQNKQNEFEEKLKTIMENSDLLERFSKEAKKEAKKYNLDNIISIWLETLKKIDNR